MLLFASLSFLDAQNVSTKFWTEEDRNELLVGLHSTQLELMKEVEGLNKTQITFKPDSSKWSIAEVLEHLGTFEELL